MFGINHDFVLFGLLFETVCKNPVKAEEKKSLVKTTISQLILRTHAHLLSEIFVVVEVVCCDKNGVTRVCLRVDEESVCWITKKQTQQNQKRVHLRIDVIESKINCQLIER